MIRIIIVAAVVLVAAIGVIALSSNKSTTAQPTSESFSSVQSAITSGAKLYDVRTNQEYASSHFKNAENWSLQDLQAGEFPDIEKSTKLYIYCQSGNRSSQATKLLKDNGFTNVTDLGGMQDVQKSGGTLQ